MGLVISMLRTVLDMLSDLVDVRSRAMFGGHDIFHDGVMIGLIASGMIYVSRGRGSGHAKAVAESSVPCPPRVR